METVYDFELKTLAGKMIHTSALKDHVLLIVNTASACGFTPQYESLQLLHERYQQSGLSILGFPCNQFGGQEPGSAEEIKGDCLVHYGVTFDVFEKTNVNGKQAHPLFQWLKEQKKGMLGKRIIWNFTKFLIDHQGQVLRRYSPSVHPLKIESDIINLIAAIH